MPRSVANARKQAADRGADLIKLLMPYAQAFAANKNARRIAEAAAKSGPAPTPSPPLSPAASAPPVITPSLPMPVSRTIPKGHPAYRLIVNCGCPFGWPTPDVPEAVECPKHGHQAVVSTASTDGWTGPLPLAVPA
jgi:hypothetical protein